MKIFRRLVSVALVVLMMASLSVSVFAATIDESDNYTFEAKVDKTTVKAGDTFVVSVYVYGSEDSFDIESDANSKLIYGYTVPKALVDMTDIVNKRNMFNSAYISKNYSIAKAAGNVNQDNADTVIVTESIAINDTTDYLAETILKDTSIADYTFKVAADVKPGTYTIAIDPANIAAVDTYTEVQMKNVVAAPAVTITVEAEQQKEAPTYTAVTGVADLNGKSGEVYTNVWTGAYTVTLNGNEAKEAKIDFDADHSYNVEFGADGDGAIAFKLAIVGAPKSAVGVPSISDGTTWVQAEKAEKAE